MKGFYKMTNLVTKYKHLKNIDPTTTADTPDADSIIIPQLPPYFKISRLKGIERNKIILEIQPHVVPTCICGDGCSVKKHILEVSITLSLHTKNKHYFRFDFDVEVVFKGRIKCTKSFTDFNRMARELQKSKEDNNSSLNQVNVRIIKPNSILKGEVN